MSDLPLNPSEDNIHQQQQDSQICSAVEQHSDYASNSSTAVKILTYDDRYPSDVLKWIKYNAKPRQSFKLMQVCKYFKFRIFPFLPVRKIENNQCNLEYWTLEGQKHQVEKVEDLPNNLWIVTKLRLYRQLNLAPLFQKIAICNIKYLILHDCTPNILLDDFKLLTESGNVEDLAIHGSTIIYENGEAVPFEVFLECVPNIVAITLNNELPPIHSLEAAKKAVRPTFKYFEFTTSTQMANFETFATFVIQNQSVEYTLLFEECSTESGFPPEYVQLLRDLIDKIIYNWCIRNSPPLISFPEQLEESYEALNTLHHKYFQCRTKND